MTEKRLFIELDHHLHVALVYSATTESELIALADTLSQMSPDGPRDILAHWNNIKPSDFLDAEGEEDAQAYYEEIKKLPESQHFQAAVAWIKRDGGGFLVHRSAEEARAYGAPLYMTDANFERAVTDVFE